MDALHQLTIKYGLGGIEPSQEQGQLWAQRTRELIAAGLTPDEAGHAAAREIFSTYRQHKYASQADTIYDLLEALG